MSDLPDPLVPPDVDLRGMPYMPLDVVRLFDSDFYALSNGAEFKAGLSLWCKAFLQVPAGSLPNDERLLAHLSGAGASWPKVRAMALHGWIRCSDGRLYHRTVAEKAMDAWKARIDRRARTEAARKARQSSRADSDTNPPPTVTTSVTESVTEDVTSVAAISVTSSKGTEGKGREGKIRKKEPPLPPEAGGRACVVDDGFEAFWQRYPRRDGKGHARKAWAAAARKAPPDAILAGLERYRFSETPRFVPMPATWLNGERWLSDDGPADGFDPVLRAVGLSPEDFEQPLFPTGVLLQ